MRAILISGAILLISGLIKQRLHAGLCVNLSKKIVGWKIVSDSLFLFNYC